MMTMWRQHGDNVGTTGMWRPCRDNMETTWGCGDHVGIGGWVDGWDNGWGQVKH